jgi:hypothetical protein
MPTAKRLALFVAAAVATAAFAMPAAAQFGSIFGGPPRPPRDVPQPRIERDPRLPVEVEPERDPWYGSRESAPEPPPPPLTRLPPDPRQDGVQSQPLPPPPGAATAPQPAPDVAARPPDGRPAPSVLPGLPPGQRQPRGTPQQGNAAVQPGDEVVVAPPSQKIVNATAVFAGLDKITGRIISFDVAINETVQFGALRLTPRACYTRPPTETPNTDGFVEVDEITLKGEVKRIFTGWMFAASPGLHAVEHPIYDVWLTDCKSAKPTVASAQPPQAGEPASSAASAPPRTPPARTPPARPVEAPPLRR